MSRHLAFLAFVLMITASTALVYRVAQNQATRAWSSGYASGRSEAEHDVALHWYRKCLDETAYEEKNPVYCRLHCDQIFEYQLGFKNRWRGEMP